MRRRSLSHPYPELATQARDQEGILVKKNRVAFFRGTNRACWSVGLPTPYSRAKMLSTNSPSLRAHKRVALAGYFFFISKRTPIYTKSYPPSIIRALAL
uniref:Unclassified n=1 Tax=Fusarium culmorum CS7071 TaxID=1318462 RepID=A0A060QN61_FUSCU|nr:unclassified [Fusarium culmorum CS7071]